MAYSLKQIMEKLAGDMGWPEHMSTEELRNLRNLTIQYKSFVRVLSSQDGAHYGSMRTIREKWRVLHAIGVFVELNQYSSRIMVDELADYLEGKL